MCSAFQLPCGMHIFKAYKFWKKKIVMSIMLYALVTYQPAEPLVIFTMPNDVFKPPHPPKNKKLPSALLWGDRRDFQTAINFSSYFIKNTLFYIPLFDRE